MPHNMTTAAPIPAASNADDTRTADPAPLEPLGDGAAGGGVCPGHCDSVVNIRSGDSITR